jgi:hypothetical protein
VARALSRSLLVLVFAPLIKAQETVLRKALRLTVLCLFIVSASTTVRAQQRILWQAGKGQGGADKRLYQCFTKRPRSHNSKAR